MGNEGYVYILFNKHNGTLYVGSTFDLITRIHQHKAKINPDCFTAKYSVDKLGYYESCGSLDNAIVRERQIKGGSRIKKLELIESMNPEWCDLYRTILNN